MTILLFGANGQVGSELRRSLLPHGKLIPLQRADVDLTDADAVRAILKRWNPTVIVNAAAYTAVDKAESEPAIAGAINRDAVAVMAELAASTGALLIHYSTDYVFAGDGDRPHEPSDVTAPKSVYGLTKREGEQAILAAGCQHLIFRTSWVFSAHGNNFVKTMLRLGGEREALRVVADQHGAPTSAELIADVTALALNGYRAGSLQSGIYHLTAGGETTWHEFAAYVLAKAKEMGLPLKVNLNQIEAIPSSEFPTPASRPANSRMSNAALESALRIHMPSWTLHADRVVEQLVRK